MAKIKMMSAGLHTAPGCGRFPDDKFRLQLDMLGGRIRILDPVDQQLRGSVAELIFGGIDGCDRR